MGDFTGDDLRAENVLRQWDDFTATERARTARRRKAGYVAETLEITAHGPAAALLIIVAPPLLLVLLVSLFVRRVRGRRG